jgi:hydrogenase-4 component F
MILYYFISAIVLSLGVLLIMKRTIAKSLMVIFVILQLCFTAYAILHKGATDLVYFTYDPLALIFLTVLSIVSVASVYQGFRYFKSRVSRRFFYYHSALIGLITAISGAYLANEITVVWILVEATTLTASVLIYHEKTTFALEATWKYIFLCSTGIAFAYMGILFLSMTMNGSGFGDLSFCSVSAVASNANPVYLKIAFLFVFIGYSTKMELFPMHTVGIDANSVAPTPVGGLISTGLVNLGFISIFRVYSALSHTGIFSWMNHVFILAGVFSILVAAGYMLKAKHNKRMLAYSTLENMGLVAIALGVGGYGYYAAILLLVLHSFVKSSLFFQMGQLYRVLNTFKLDDNGQYMKIYPAGGMVLLIGLICILAIPPSGLFYSEYLICKSLIYANNWFVLIITLLLLCFVIYAMTTRFMHILFSMPRERDQLKPYGKVNAIETVSQYLFLGIVIFICFYQPPFLIEIINQAISQLPLTGF